MHSISIIMETHLDNSDLESSYSKAGPQHQLFLEMQNLEPHPKPNVQFAIWQGHVYAHQSVQNTSIVYLQSQFVVCAFLNENTLFFTYKGEKEAPDRSDLVLD